MNWLVHSCYWLGMTYILPLHCRFITWSYGMWMLAASLVAVDTLQGLCASTVVGFVMTLVCCKSWSWCWFGILMVWCDVFVLGYAWNLECLLHWMFGTLQVCTWLHIMCKMFDALTLFYGWVVYQVWRFGSWLQQICIMVLHMVLRPCNRYEFVFFGHGLLAFACFLLLFFGVLQDW